MKHYSYHNHKTNYEPPKLSAGEKTINKYTRSIWTTILTRYQKKNVSKRNANISPICSVFEVVSHWLTHALLVVITPCFTHHFASSFGSEKTPTEMLHQFAYPTAYLCAPFVFMGFGVFFGKQIINVFFFLFCFCTFAYRSFGVIFFFWNGVYVLLFESTSKQIIHKQKPVMKIEWRVEENRNVRFEHFFFSLFHLMWRWLCVEAHKLLNKSR